MFMTGDNIIRDKRTRNYCKYQYYFTHTPRVLKRLNFFFFFEMETVLIIRVLNLSRGSVLREVIVVSKTVRSRCPLDPAAITRRAPVGHRKFEKYTLGFPRYRLRRHCTYELINIVRRNAYRYNILT